MYYVTYHVLDRFRECERVPFSHIGLLVVDYSVAVPIGDGLVFLITQEKVNLYEIYKALLRTSSFLLYISEIRVRDRCGWE